MGILRALGTTICSILLFFALSVFGVAFLLNSTVINVNFMNSQIDKMDITSIAHDTIEKQIIQDLPQNAEFVNGVVLKIIGTQEPLIKQQLHTGINEGYDYFLEKESKLSVIISLTAIKQSLKDNVWQTAVDYLKTQLANLSDQEVDKYVQNIAVDIPASSLPSALAGLPESLRLDIIKQYLKELGGRGIFNNASFGLDFLVKPMVKSSVEQYFSDAIANVPDTLTVDESTINSGTMNTIRDVRTAVHTFKAAYIWLIIFMIFMAGLIFLINWGNIRGSMRTLGVDLLLFGIIDLAGVLVVRYLKPEKFIFENTNLPVSVQNWIHGLIADITGIMLVFSIGVLVVGVVFMAVSFIIKKPETAT